MPNSFPFYRDQFTPAQRRRVEALVFTAALFPNATPGRTHAEIACWVTTGRWNA